MIKSQDLKKYGLPDTPGVYLFKKDEHILYVGKATSLKDRVKSYFSKDLISTRGPLLVDLIYKANKIDYIKTNSVLEALILEANLIKKFQPRFNTKEKDNKSFNYVIITDEDFPRVLIERGRNLFQKSGEKAKYTFGPFTNSTQLKEAIKIIRKIFPFRDKCTPLIGKPCFNKQIGLCPGVCDGSINKKDYNNIIKKIKLFFSGKTDNLKNSLKKEMAVLAKAQEYEKANEIKRQIFALEHIQDVALIKEDYANQKETPEKARTNGLADTCFLTREEIRGPEGEVCPELLVKGFRIEAYDVSHLSGTNNVGAMVVMENDELKKSDYRKFKINNSQGDDIHALKEILERRFKHTEWPIPNLIVVDGGSAHLNVAKTLMNQSGTLIKVVAVTKDDKHKAKAIIGDEKIVNKYKKKILYINNEAHRFVISYHRQKRSKL